LDEGGGGHATEGGGSVASYGRESDDSDGERSDESVDVECEWVDCRDSADLDGKGIDGSDAGGRIGSDTEAREDPTDRKDE